MCIILKNIDQYLFGLENLEGKKSVGWQLKSAFINYVYSKNTIQKLSFYLTVPNLVNSFVWETDKSKRYYPVQTRYGS
jgi:hypothetical protein